MSGDTVWIDVLPSMSGFAKDLVSGSTKAGQEAGKASGSAWSSTFAGAAGDAGSNAAVQKLEAASKNATKAVQNQTVAISKARAAQADANAKVVEAEEKLRLAREAGDPSKVEAAELRLQSARDRAEAAGSKYEQTELALKAAKSEQKEVTNQLETAEKDLGEQTKDTTDKAEKQAAAWDGLKGTLKKAAVGTAAAFAAVAAGSKVLYDIGSTFDDMSDTIRVGTGATGQALEGLVDTAKSVATSVPTDFETASSTVADLNTRLGLTGDTLKTVSSQVIEAGNMLGKELDINQLSGSLNAFNIKGKDTSGVLDHLFRVSQATGIGMDELAATVEKQAPAVQSLGFSYEQTASMVGLLDRAGLDSTAVINSMGKGLVKLAKDGEEPASAFQRVSKEIEGYIKSGDDAKAMKLAAEVFGTKGATQFTAALKNGSLALDALSESGLASSDTILGAASETHDFAEAWEMFKNDVLVQIEPIASKVFGLIGDGMKWLRDEGVPVIKDIGGEIIDRVSPAFESFGSYIADTLVPAFKDTSHWIADNKDWLSAIAVGIGSVVAVWGAWKIATSAWTIVTNIATAAQGAFNLVMNANPVMLVVTAVAALVAGLVYFFTKTETGKKLWEDFTGALSSAWDATVNAISTAWTWLGDALSASWQWVEDNVLTPVGVGWDLMKLGFVIMKDKVVEAWGKVKDGLKSGWDWIFKWIVTPYINAWGAVKDGFVFMKDKVVEAWGRLKDGLKAGWDWILKYVITPYVDAWISVKNGFQTANDSILVAWGKVKDGLKSGWDWIGDKVFDPMKKGVDAIGKAFDKTKDFIGKAWDKIKEVAAKPVNFIIETVYTKGIKNVWDTIAGKVGLDLKLPSVKPIKFASGGVLPGYTPGEDVHDFYSPTAGRLSLSGGEAIMRPEFTRAVGGEAGVHRLNALARTGQLAFAEGGVWDRVKSGAKSAWNWTADKAGKAWDWTKNTAESVANFVSDPLAAIAELIGKPVQKMLGNIAPGVVGDVLKQIPGKVLNSLGDWANSALFGRETEGAPASGSGGIGMGYRAMVALLKGRFPDLQITSTYRPGAITATGYPSMHGMGRAVDMAPRMDVFNWLRSAYPNSRELIFSPAGGRQLYNGRNHYYTGVTRNMHFNHVHWGMASGGVLPKNLNFGTYDTGGVLPPGDTLVSNKTGLPELILNPEQIAGLGQPRGPIDLSERTIDRLASRIAKDLGVVGDTVRDVHDAVGGARTLERMG